MGPGLALLPIAVLLALMLGLRWSTAAASVVALVVSLALAFGVFDLAAAPIGPARMLLGAFAEAGFATLTITWILLPALAIYHLQQRTGAIEVLRQAVHRAAAEPEILALLIAWFFALCLEGAAGFGTPIALAAPFLVSAGWKPTEAVTLALIGHAAGVAFGAIGTPIQAQVTITGLEPLVLSAATGLYAAVVGWTLPLAMVHVIRRDRGDRGDRGRHGRTMYLWALAAAGLFIAPYYALALWVGPELPTLVGGFAGGLAFAVAWRLSSSRRHSAPVQEPGSVRELAVAAAPYLVVLVLVLVTRTVAPVRDALDVSWRWTLFERFTGTMNVLLHPGSLLLVSLVIAAAVQRAPARTVMSALAAAARQLAMVVVALLAVLALSRVMVHAGMIETLARAAAAAAGSAWPLFAPFVGVLGTFVTGSATSSNILFTELQAAAAAELGLHVPSALGAQSFGAAAGNMIAPMNVVAGAATVGCVGSEGDIMRRVLGICLLYTLLGGLVALLWW
jgi:lactate permease